MATLYYEPKNPGRIACDQHVGMSAGPRDRVPEDELKQEWGWVDGVWHDGDIEVDAKCEDCGATDDRTKAGI